MGLGPGLNWSILAKNNNKKKTVVLITEIKNQEYHVNLHLLLIFLISMVPHFGGQWELSSFLSFSQKKKLRVKCRTCVVVDKTRTTYGHRLVDLRTYWQYTDCITKYGPIIHGSLDKPWTYISQTWQSTVLLFTDLTKHGTLFKLRTPLMIYQKKKKKKKKIGVISKLE